MIIFGILIIPFIITFFLFLFFRHKIVWWELLLPLGVSLIVLLAIFWADFFYQTTDKAIQSVFIEEVIFEEEWDEEVDDVCYTTECDEIGENCRQISYSCKKVVLHPELYYARTAHNKSIKLTKAQFDKMQKTFNNLNIHYPNRNYYSIQGARYSSLWGQDTNSAIIYGDEQYYINRLNAADQSVFFEKMGDDEANYKEFLYPIIETTSNFNSQCIYSPWELHRKYNHKLNFMNASFSESSDIQVLLLFYDNLREEVSYHQQVEWKTGKKNQFVIAIGMQDSIQPNWCRVFSWTDNEQIKLKTRNYIINRDILSIDHLITFLNDEIAPDFVSKDFSEFSYLSIDPKPLTTVLAYISVFILSLIVTIWCIFNPIY